MKNLFLLFALLLGSISFSQSIVITNTTACDKYVQVDWVDNTCTGVPGSPGGWIVIPAGGMHNFTTAVPAAGDLLRVLITSATPMTCPVLVLDNPVNPCWTGPTGGAAPDCKCGGNFNANLTVLAGPPGNYVITIT